MCELTCLVFEENKEVKEEVRKAVYVVSTEEI